MKVFLCTWPAQKKMVGGDLMSVRVGFDWMLEKVYLVASRSNGQPDDKASGSVGQMGQAVSRIYLGAETNGKQGGGQDTRAMADYMRWYASGNYAMEPPFAMLGEERLKVYLGAETGARGLKGGHDHEAMAQGAQGGLRPLRVLLSYHYFKDADVGEMLDRCFGSIPIDVFADSGAFSAWSIGEKVIPDEYIAWVNKWKPRFTAVSGPDVIGDPAATARESERMLGLVSGIPVLPVFHVGEPWDYLTRWIGKVDYLAFGGMVPYTRQRGLLATWLKRAFSLLPPTMKVHGFGLTTWDLLLEFPFYSVDSSSWTSGFRYANLTLFDSQRGRLSSVQMSDPHDLLRNQKLLASYGVRASEAKADSYDRAMLCGVCVASWHRAEAWLEEYWKRKRGT